MNQVNEAVRQRARAHLFISELLKERFLERYEGYTDDLLDAIYKNDRKLSEGYQVNCTVTLEFQADELLNFICEKLQNDNTLEEDLFEI